MNGTQPDTRPKTAPAAAPALAPEVVPLTSAAVKDRKFLIQPLPISRLPGDFLTETKKDPIPPIPSQKDPHPDYLKTRFDASIPNEIKVFSPGVYHRSYKHPSAGLVVEPQEIEKIAQALRALLENNPGAKITIDVKGMASADGNPAANAELAAKRARAVRDLLVEQAEKCGLSRDTVLRAIKMSSEVAAFSEDDREAIDAMGGQAVVRKYNSGANLAPADKERLDSILGLKRGVEVKLKIEKATEAVSPMAVAAASKDPTFLEKHGWMLKYLGVAAVAGATVAVGLATAPVSLTCAGVAIVGMGIYDWLRAKK